MQYTLKKSLGQHFLKDENMCKKITDVIQEALHENKLQHLLEVGPGAGAITKYLLQIPNINYKVVELDEEKVNYLETTYANIQSKIIHQDFLEMNTPFEENFMVAGNFPYNISSQIVFKTLEMRDQIPEFAGMFQKEVAERICEKKGSKTYGILSVLVQAFYEPEYLFTVSENVFNPPPKVKSGVMRMRRKENYRLPCNEKHFFTVVKTAFNQRRKTLRNSLKSLSIPDAVRDEKIFDLRPEQLSVEQFIEITKMILN